LLAAIPQVAAHDERLASIPGVVPDPHAMPTGCRFHPRCPYAIPECASAPVELLEAGEQHRARCIRIDELSLKGAK
jgi:oligopeptide/dipeptide ABC transporter ATP-binding protein